MLNFAGDKKNYPTIFIISKTTKNEQINKKFLRTMVANISDGVYRCYEIENSQSFFRMNVK